MNLMRMVDSNFSLFLKVYCCMLGAIHKVRTRCRGERCLTKSNPPYILNFSLCTILWEGVLKKVEFGACTLWMASPFVKPNNRGIPFIGIVTSIHPIFRISWIYCQLNTREMILDGIRGIISLLNTSY